MAPCTATLTTQQRAIKLVRAGRKRGQPAIHRQLAQTHDGGTAKARTRFHKQKCGPHGCGCVCTGGAHVVKKGREGFEKTVQPVFAAAFGLIRLCAFRCGVAVKIHTLVIQRIKFVFFLNGAGPA